MKNLVISAGVAVCIALCIASAAAESAAAEIKRDQLKSSITTETGMLEFRAKRRGGRRQNLRKGNCDSVMNQNCTPSAHLASMGMQWQNTIVDSTTHESQYRTNWICKEEDAFVDCGMEFTYNEQKLYVPVCGVYEIYSQVLFRSNVPDMSAVVLHRVEIDRNCDHSSDNRAEFKSYAGLVPVSVSRTTSTNLATVKMCAGGSVSVVVPVEGNTCCAHGDKSNTYFSARLISEVDCDTIQ